MKKISWLNILLILLNFILFSSEKPNEKRVVTIGICLDEECQKIKEWEFFRNLVEEVSKDFENDYALVLSPKKYQPWKSNNKFHFLDLLFQSFIRKVAKENFDIVLGFTNQEGIQGSYGISLYQEAYILVRFLKDRTFLKKVLKHEICHLFGATHVDDKKDLMDRFLRGTELGQENKKIINLHMERNFKNIGFPLPREKFAKLIELYNKIALSNELLKNSKLPSDKRRQLRKKLNFLPSKESTLQTVQKAYSGLEDVYIYLVFIFIEMEKYDEALNTCEKVLRINPDLNEVYNLMGIASRRSGKINRAIQYYKKVLKSSPDYLKVYYNLGIAYMKRGDVDLAVSAYKKAIGLNPHFADPWNNLGYIDLEKGRLDQALEKFKKAIDLNPFFPLAYSNLAEGLLRKGQVDIAFEKVKKALTLDSRLPGPHNILGKIYSAKREFHKAEKEYKIAISLKPGYYKAYFNLGNICFKKSQLSQARKYFQKSIDISPRFGPGYAGLGDCFIIEGHLDQAERKLNRAVNLGYKTAQVYLNLSFIKIKKKDYDGAIHYGNLARTDFPGQEKVHQNLGIAYFLKGMLPQAEQEFKDVLRLNPKHADMHKNLMMLYLLKKDYVMAGQYMEKYEKLGFQVNEELKNEILRYKKEQEK